MPFAPGQSGNPEGRRIEFGKFRAALDRAISQDDAKRLREAAEQLLTMAAAGNLAAIQMLADRMDGKAMQQLEIGGANGAPLTIVVAKDDNEL